MTTDPQRNNRQAQDGCVSRTLPAAAREWITLKEMQEMLTIGSTKAYEIATSGSIPGVIKIGRAIRINRRELESWLQEQSITAYRK